MSLRQVLGTACMFTTTVGFAQPRLPTLTVGDAAPKLTVGKWIKGDAVTDYQKGRIYVVEFWATWCGPCKEAIPHLTDLAHKYKDAVSFVGVSVWEDNPNDVGPLVSQMGDKMNYTVAQDQVSSGDEHGVHGQMAMSWMQASGQENIPTAFIIDKDSKIAWVGETSQLDQPLAKVVAGSYSPDDYQKAKASQLQDAKRSYFDERLNDAANSEDDKKILAVLDEMIADSDSQTQINAANMKFSLLLGEKRYDEAYAFAQTLISGLYRDNCVQLDGLAYAIVAPTNGPEKKDLDVAMSAAQRSVEIQRTPQNLDTLARVYFLKGNKTKAVEAEKLALAIVPKDQQQPYLDAIKEFGG